MASLASPMQMVMGWLSRKSTSMPSAGSIISSLFPNKMVSKPPERGVTGMLNAYNRSPWVRAVTSKISGTFASADWRVFAARKAGTERGWVKLSKYQMNGFNAKDYDKKRLQMPDGIDMVEIFEHPSLEFLNNASQGFPSIISRQLTQTYRELAGEAFWLLDLQQIGGKVVPVGFWLVPPTWIVDIPTPENPFFEVNPLDGVGRPFKIPMKFMIWFCNPDPLKPYNRGSGHMRALGDEIDADEYAAQHVRAWFYNSARPDLLIFGRDLARTDTDQLEAKWMHKLQGYLKAHRPFFLKASVEVRDISHKFKDMQMLELRKFERDMLIHARGVPPEVFGIIENSNRATIDAADYLFNKHVIVPELDTFRSQLQMHLMPYYDDRLILAYESPVGEDKEYKLEVAKSARWSLTINELRAMAGEEPVEYGNVHVFQLQDVVVTPEQLEGGFAAMLNTTSTSSSPASPSEEVNDDDSTPPTNEEQEAAFLPRTPAKGVAAPVKPPKARKPARSASRAPSEPVAKVASGGIDTTNLALGLSKEMEVALVDSFSQLQGELNMTALIAALERGDLDAAATIIESLEVDESLQPAKQVLIVALLTITNIAATQLAGILGIEVSELELVSSVALEELANFGAGMVRDVSDNTIDAIRVALVEGYGTGRSATEVAEEIRSIIGLTKFQAKQAIKKYEAYLADGYTIAQAKDLLESWISDKIKRRAQTIAENELIYAGTRGQEMIWEEAVKHGLINSNMVLREWIISYDACEICVLMAGIKAPIGQPFKTSKGNIYTPNDIHVKCRCGERLVFLTIGG